MKIRPVILCGGSGDRLWPDFKKHQAKQFIDFGNWTLLSKTFERLKAPIFDTPIISTNLKYLKEVRKHLKKCKIKDFKIILEPSKRNTAPAILSAALIKDIPDYQPLIFFAADHLIEKINTLNLSIKKNIKNLNHENIFLFGIKPTNPSKKFGYFLTKKNNSKMNKVIKFIEKPDVNKAKKIIKNKGYWNSGIFLLRKDSLINNFKKYQPNILSLCKKTVFNAKIKKNIYYLNKFSFNKLISKSFDKAILEKSSYLEAIKLNIPWSDLGSWEEICKMYEKNKKKYYKNENIFFRPWGKYINLFKGKNFLIKEIHVNPKGVLSLQKHFHRCEHWLITQGRPKITLNNKTFIKKPKETIFIPIRAIHRISNPYKTPVKIIEAQLGSKLSENDIIRYDDIYGRSTE